MFRNGQDFPKQVGESIPSEYKAVGSTDIGHSNPLYCNLLNDERAVPEAPKTLSRPGGI